jgi:hypothetical protein
MLATGVIFLAVAVTCGFAFGAAEYYRKRYSLLPFVGCLLATVIGGHLLFAAGQKDAVGIVAYDGDGYRIGRSLETGAVYRVVGTLVDPDDSTGTIVFLKDSTGEVRAYNFGMAPLPDVFIVVENTSLRYVPFPKDTP